MSLFFSIPLAWASFRSSTSLAQSMNFTSRPALTASTPIAVARWVFPTPGLPTSSTFSALSTNLSVESSSISGLGTEGWNDQSKSASAFTHGNPDDRILSRVILCVLASTSTRVIPASAEQKPASPSATILM